MAEFTNVLNEYAHTLYTKLVEAAFPQETPLIDELPFDRQYAQGGDYTQHVIVAEEAGFVHGASGDGALAAPTAIALETVKATVNGYQVGIVSTIDYESAERASNSRKAYADIAGKKQASGFSAMRKRIEDELTWGQSGLGKCATSANVNATTTTITLTLSEFAPWLWAGKKNYSVVAYNGTTVVGAGSFAIARSNVSRDVRTLRVTGVAGDIAALDAAILANPNVITLFWAGTVTGSVGTYTNKTMVGIMKAATTTTGLLFGVDLDANTDAAPNTYGAAGAMSFAKSLQVAEILVGRGVVESLRLDVNPRTWNNMMTDQAALVRFGGKQKKLENGADALEFYTQGVSLEITGNGRMKEGYALCRPKSGLKRIGARDISMVTPGSAGSTKGDIWYHDPSRFGYSWRIWTHQAFFAEELHKLCGITGIVNT